MHASARRHSANADGLLQTSQHLLPPVQAKDSSKKCVVIDLDETLVHSSFKVIAKDSRCDVTLLINSLDLFETRPGYISLHVIPVVHVSRRDCYCCAFSTNSLITTCFLFTRYSYDILCWRDVYCAHWPGLFLSAAGPHSTSTCIHLSRRNRLHLTHLPVAAAARLVTSITDFNGFNSKRKWN